MLSIYNRDTFNITELINSIKIFADKLLFRLLFGPILLITVLNHVYPLYEIIFFDQQIKYKINLFIKIIIKKIILYLITNLLPIYLIY